MGGAAGRGRRADPDHAARYRRGQGGVVRGAQPADQPVPRRRAPRRADGHRLGTVAVLARPSPTATPSYRAAAWPPSRPASRSPATPAAWLPTALTQQPFDDRRIVEQGTAAGGDGHVSYAARRRNLACRPPALGRLTTAHTKACRPTAPDQPADSSGPTRHCHHPRNPSSSRPHHAGQRLQPYRRTATRPTSGLTHGAKASASTDEACMTTWSKPSDPRQAAATTCVMPRRAGHESGQIQEADARICARA